LLRQTTRAGLKVEERARYRDLRKGIKVSDAEMKTLNIQGDEFHPEWNFTIRPRSAANRTLIWRVSLVAPVQLCTQGVGTE